VSDAVFAFWDFLPTCADLAGAEAPAGIDGISFAPVLRGKPMAGREYLYWEFHERGFSQAVRFGNWKGVRNASRKNPIELYDIVKDPGESQNVAAQNAAIVKRIAEIMVSARTDSPTFPIREQR
jgi:arylsulfatase A